MLKAIHAQEDKGAALDKLEDVVGKLKEMKLFEAAKKVEETGIETLMYMDFPREHWRRIRSNNAMERLKREIRRIPRRSVCVDVSVCQVEAHARLTLRTENLLEHATSGGTTTE